MTSPFDFDLVVKNGFIVTASDTVRADIGVKDGKVVLSMADIPVPAGCEVIDAEGGFVTVRSLLVLRVFRLSRLLLSCSPA